MRQVLDIFMNSARDPMIGFEAFNLFQRALDALILHPPQARKQGLFFVLGVTRCGGSEILQSCLQGTTVLRVQSGAPPF